MEAPNEKRKVLAERRDLLGQEPTKSDSGNTAGRRSMGGWGNEMATTYKGFGEGIKPSAAQLGHILAGQRLLSDPDLAAATEGEPQWYALPAGGRQAEVGAHLGLLGYRVDDRVEGHIIFQSKDVERDLIAIEGTPGAGKILAHKKKDGDGVASPISEKAMAKIKPVTPAVASKLTPHQKVKRRLKRIKAKAEAKKGM
jgi:hypothetical protein